MVTRRRARWIWACLGAYAGIIAVVVLTPISYSRVIQWTSDRLAGTFRWDGFGSGWIEFAGNVLIFIPLGLLLTLLLPRPWLGVALALVISILVEVAQMVIPSREPSLRDILANLLGASVGAAIAWALELRRRRRADKG